MVANAPAVVNHDPGAQHARDDGPGGQPTYRGPLKYEVETSLSQIEAGRKISVFVRVTNPYDVPIKIHKVESVMPVEFYDPTQRNPSIWELFKETFMEELEPENKQMVHMTAFTVDNNGDEPSTAVLLPGSTKLYAFKLRTKRSILFIPSLYNLHMQTMYEVKPGPRREDHAAISYDTVRYQINVRAPLKAMIYGAVIGAYIGALLRTLHDGAELTLSPYASKPFFVLFVSSALLGAVIVVAFARKKDVQPFISIEDFWGGFFVGFLAGYVGKPLLGQIMPEVTKA